MANSLKSFVGLEDEIVMRIQYKNVLKHEGLPGMIQVLGELNAAFLIALQVMKEHINENGKAAE